MSPVTPYRAPGALADHAAFALVRSPRAAKVIARLLVAFVVGAAAMLTLAPWQQSASGTGRVIAYAPLERQQNVEATITGRVTYWHVREGSRVREGDPLVELSDNDPQILTRLREERDAITARLDAARSRVASVEARVEALRNSQRNAAVGAAARVRMAQARVRSAEQGVRAADAALVTATLNRDRQASLVRDGLASTRNMELAELGFVRARTDVDRAQAALSAARSEESALDGDRLRVGTDLDASINDGLASRASALSEVASASASLAGIEVRLARQNTQRIRAPRNGTVLRLVGGQGGEMVKPGDPLVVLVPDTDARAAELWVDGNDAPLLAEGRRVRLQFEGWPAVQFTGWPSVAVGTFGGRVALIDATDNGQGKFRVVVVPDGEQPWPSGRYLRQGVRANGWVLLNRVRLGYELWRLFNGFPPTVAPAEPRAGGSYGGSSGGSYGGSS